MAAHYVILEERREGRDGLRELLEEGILWQNQNDPGMQSPEQHWLSSTSGLEGGTSTEFSHSVLIVWEERKMQF